MPEKVEPTLSDSETQQEPEADVQDETGTAQDSAESAAQAESDLAAGAESASKEVPGEAEPVAGPSGSTAELPDFSKAISQAAASSIDLLNDVELNVKIELGRADMTIHDILHLNEGSVVELDKLAGDPVDVLVNEKLVARGEVLVVNDNFCVRINEIISGISEREIVSPSETV